MQNILLTLQYDGTRYLGWQKPAKEHPEKTVSHRITSVLNKLTKEEITLHAGAKTEPGVHALAQTVSFRTDSHLSPCQLQNSLNEYLPMDIAVLDCRSVPERFQADLNAISRTYEYRIDTSRVYDLFKASYTSHIYPAPDISAMQTGAGFLLGTHDFLCFSAARKKKGTVKKILDISFSVSEAENHLLRISITADDFLYRMPSLIIGTLLSIGQGNLNPEIIPEILQGQKTGVPCETKGLLLKSVQY